MKSKKLLVTLSSTILLLCGCDKTYSVPPIMGNGGDGGNQPVVVEPTGNEIVEVQPIDTYLVLSSIGLYNNEKGKNIDELMLENTVIFHSLPGLDLPTKDEITAINGSKGEFNGWVCYEGDGFPKVYTTVPNEPGKVLYATFKNGDGSGQGQTIDNPDKLTPIYLDATKVLNNETGESWLSGNAAITMFVWSYSTGDSEWIAMKNNGQGIFTANVNLERFTNVIFLRHSGSVVASFNDGGYWNKTGDLLFVADKNCFQITDWNNSGVWTNK